jgi:hypothetical protein
LRVWQRTAAKRAARQVETELAIEERQERQRAYATATADELLAAAVVAPLHIGRAALRRLYMQAPVDVGDLERPLEPPRPSQFGRLPWPPWSRVARERRHAEVESQYEAAVAEYEQAEFDRVRRLSTAKRDHQRSQAEAAERLWTGYRAGEPDAVATYATVVLASRDGGAWHVQYDRDERLITVEHELPEQVTLRVLFDLFHTIDEEFVGAISCNGVTVTRSRWAAASVLDDDAPAVLRKLASDGRR